MPGLMSGDWKRSTVSGPQRLQPVRGQRRTYRLPRQPSTLTSYAGFNACFATFVPEDDADVLGAVQRPLALGSFTTVSGTPAWASIPSWAVIGTQDQAIPPAELTFMAQRAQSKITHVLAGHLSMITQPRVVADVIREAADATW